jgi:hypothetical protein
MQSFSPESESSDPTDSCSSSRNPRQPPEESGPFGRNRSNRYTGTRSSRTRTGTTPVRQKENPTVAEFGRLFAKEQAREEEEERSRTTLPNPPATGGTQDAPRAVEPEAVATECIIYGYASKAVEWKVISKYERIVTPAIICEDYPREDPNLFLSSTTAFSHSRSAIVVHKNLTKDALKKSRTYRGGNHWIKVTFDSYQAAERACFYSPVEIDGHMVFCEMWQGRGPFSDAPLLKGSAAANEHQKDSGSKMRTLTTSQATTFRTGLDSGVAGFERATQTLPRSFVAPDIQHGQPATRDDASVSSTTASSATATEYGPPSVTSSSNLRSRSVPSLPTQIPPRDPLYMTHIPTVKRAVLRPISDALLPQPTFVEKVIRSIPIISTFFGKKGKFSEGLIGEGPALTEDGKFDEKNNGWYWSAWYWVDSWLKTDFCGLKDD